MNKKKAEQRHALRRFSERAQIRFSKQLNAVFCRKIRNTDAIFVKRSSNRVTIWDIEHEKRTYTCVYDKIRKQIVTVLKVRDNDLSSS